MPATVHHLPIRPRQTLRDLCEPSREQDEALLRVIAAYEAEGGQVLFSDDLMGEAATREDAGASSADLFLLPQSEALSTSPAPFVSPYLERPLRTEDEARAQLSRPRIPKARGLLDLIAEQTGLDRNFAKLFGGGQ